MALPRTAEEKKEDLIHQVVARIRDRYPAEGVTEVETFVREYYRRVGPEDLIGRGVGDLYGAALAHWNLGHRRHPGQRLIRVYNPRVEEHGWHSTHTIVEIVQDDIPFLVDSTAMELNRYGLTVHLIIHPVLTVQRNAQGLITCISSEETAEGARAEAFLHFEVDRQTDPEMLETLRSSIGRVLDDVGAAVEDWPRMREKLAQAAAELERQPPPISPDALAETQAFLRWLREESFTFLGYREYRLEAAESGKQLRIVPDSGLGIAREPRRAVLSESFRRLPDALRDLATQPEPLILTKGSSQATVHRAGYLDYVGVRRFDENGEAVGEARFLGRYTSAAYTTRPTDIPLLRRKVAQAMQRSGLRAGSHSAKALLNILETLPRDELFQGSVDELYAMATGILHLQERQQVRVLIRRDLYHRFLSCLVYLPRERFNTEVRLRVQEVLRQAFDASHMDFAVSISESKLARLYLTVHTREGMLPAYDVREIEQRIVQATRSWSDELHRALLQELGEEQGNRVYARYRGAFPASYCEDYSAEVAVQDIRAMESLEADEAIRIALYRPLESTSGHLRIKLFRLGRPISLSTILPMLENMGVKVADERPHEVHPAHRGSTWVHDLGMEFAHDERTDTERTRHEFHEAFARVWDGVVENDGFNRLVLHAACSWRQAALLRAYCKYLLQTEFPFSQRYVEQALVNQAQITRMLVDLFQARFDPEARATSQERCERLSDGVERSLEAIPSLDEDRILRRFYQLVQSTLRTNYFQTEHGAPKTHLSFKLDPAQLPDIPEPRPQFEIFVYSPQVEGVHLRAGRVARGGIRWSDRPEDFRTEVFGLMKAQMVKNAVIVPVGAKGGFVVKRPPTDSRRMKQEVIACYSTFIRGLLDITDNRDGGRIVPPGRTVRYDEDDPYLVVAADKGTATFSDLANRIAGEYRFWLGDAFASGGSTGYDHKKMGITARGGWESVKRHFRELGANVQTTPFTVVGIGSMNGDVFGNGMLLSRHIRLLAAFSQSHIFVDPDPDPAIAFAERERLFRLGRSWSDYDPDRLSAGGGVYARSAKSIPLSPEACAVLGTEADNPSPAELVRAILRAPVDLLWNGGIGTFIKASDESHNEVGDRTNDAVRVNARELRCRVIGEGGNLGLTQRGRIEYARHGGRVNADFIDNSGGVDCSDHEVNIKILLSEPVRSGHLTEERRNRLLAEMTQEVAAIVLRDNYQQTEALSMSEHHAAERLPEHAAFMRALEREGVLERDTWALPDDDSLEARRLAGEGLTRPELAVLLSYSKIVLFDALVAAGADGDSGIDDELGEYFPAVLVRNYGEAIANHQLRPEMTATVVANNLVNRLGITAAYRIEELSGSGPSDIARAFVAARRIFGLPRLWQAVSGLDNRVAVTQQLEMLDDVRRLARRATLWLLRNFPQPLCIADAVDKFGPGAAELASGLAGLLDPSDRSLLDERRTRFLELGLPKADAGLLAIVPVQFASLDVASVANELGRPIRQVAGLYFTLGAALGIHWLDSQVALLPADDHWGRLAREAMRDELFRIHRTLTVEALQAGPVDGSPPTLMADWADTNATVVDYYHRRAEQFRASSGPDFALLSVALSDLRRLIRGGRA